MKPATSPGIVSPDFLRTLPLFGDLPSAELARLGRAARIEVAEAGDVLMHEGTEGDGLYIVRSGEVEVTRGGGANQVTLAVTGEGAFFGEMSLLGDSPRCATVRAVTPTEVVVISPDDFAELLRTRPASGLAVLRTILARLRDTELSLNQHAKLASLGTLAAGLAHELNNPASAIQRTAAHLRDALVEWEAAVGRLAATGATIESPSRSPVPPPLITPQEEKRMEAWLDGRVADPAGAAANLLECGFSREELEAIAAPADADAPIALEWLAARCAAMNLVDEITRSAEALTTIIRAVKGYTFLDGGTRQRVDVGRTIDDTLSIMRYRIGANVTVIRDDSPDVPRVEVYGTELTQLWTSLIANAVEAMEGRGCLELRVFSRDAEVVVQVTDSGPGIPQPIVGRIFDPFFTTKAPGEGAGLGLHLAYGIVQKHRGSISVESRPGRTTFEVVLPTAGVDLT